MSLILVCKSNNKFKLYLNNQEQHYINRIIALLDFVVDFDKGISATTSRRITSFINTSLENGTLLEFTHNNRSIPYIKHESRPLPGTVHPISGSHLIIIRRFCDFVSKCIGIKTFDD